MVGKHILSRIKKKRDPIEERLYRFDDVKIKIFRYKHEKDL